MHVSILKRFSREEEAVGFFFNTNSASFVTGKNVPVFIGYRYRKYGTVLERRGLFSPKMSEFYHGNFSPIPKQIVKEYNKLEQI
jgi:hypothetical protein